MAVHLYNSLTRQKEEFQPIEPGKVRMYVCGPTVYDQAHIGHAMSAIVFDVIRRYLEFRGFEVKFVQNFTDVDDKIIRRANEIGEDWLALSRRYVQEFLDETRALNIKSATVYPKATESIDQIQAMIAGLIERGFAYAVGGDVYFRVAKVKDYGKLSNRQLEEMQAGARVGIDVQKEHPMDFALWKGAKAGEPAWPSPWGPGRPGWHIECSAMNLEHLGAAIDIHGGGRDLIFPHHENEIVQSEAFTGHLPFARYWMHNGLLLVDDEKMSKSLGNYITIKDVLEKGEGLAYRYFVVTSHYRKPVNYTRGDFEAARRGLRRLAHGLRVYDAPASVDAAASAELARAVETAESAFTAAMDDDFNTPDALAAQHTLVRAINQARDGHASAESVAAGQAMLRRLMGVLGVDLDAAAVGAGEQAADPFIELLIDVRSKLRAAKQWALADAIRDGLAERGVGLEDGPAGTTFRYAD